MLQKPGQLISRIGLVGTDFGSSLEGNGGIYFLFGDSSLRISSDPFPIIADRVYVSGVSKAPGFIQSSVRNDVPNLRCHAHDNDLRGGTV
jgi:hypothetical protein